MSRDIEWYAPRAKAEPIQLDAGEIYITKQKIYFSNDLVEGLKVKKLEIGISMTRHAVYFRASETGFRLKQPASKKHYFVEPGVGKTAKALATLTKGNLIQKEYSKCADGSYAVFL